ncbi:hypothetical protein D3OALGB2SA_4057 [Olavius algarvensis associated proteobacterium Delta 3]|nr:hypothetical protein D3OALGB2SA_4057 [Olavius algarvensis associated proteobacterium Delta 3]
MEQKTKAMAGLVAKALICSTGIFAVNAIMAAYFDFFPWRRLADAVFLQGGVMILVAGCRDFASSLTVSNIRKLRQHNAFNQPPVKPSSSAGASVILLIGIFLCVQALIVAPLFF